MDLTRRLEFSLKPIGEILFLEQAWQGYRDKYSAMTHGGTLADVPANRQRFFHAMRRMLDEMLGE